MYWQEIGIVLVLGIAIYYLIPIKKNNLIQRKKAMYSPIKSQIDNKKVLKFIKLSLDC